MPIRRGVRLGERTTNERAVLTAYVRELRRRGLTDRTVYEYRKTLTAYANWATVKLDGREAEEEDVQCWLDGCNIGRSSRATYLKRLGRFFRYGVKLGLFVSDPTEEIVRPRVPAGVPRPILDEDLAAGLAHADARMRCWLQLCAFEGFRCIEVARLRREDVLETHRPPLVRIERGKGEKPAVVPLNPLVEASLRAYGMPLRGFVFLNVHGRPFNPHTISLYIGRHFRDLDMTWTAQQLRHWAGSAVLAASGGDLALTQDFMRHASPATTRVYTQLIPGKLARVVTGLSVSGPHQHERLFDA